VTDITCECGGETGYLSVLPATILSTTTKEEPMEEINYPEVIASLESRIKNLEYTKENLNNSVNRYYAQEQQLRSYLMDNHEELDMHTEEIADIFNISLTKEVEFEATITVTGTVEVSIFEGTDLEDFLSENLYVDSGHGDVCINGHQVDNVTEV
jgi:hypothetical protein